MQKVERLLFLPPITTSNLRFFRKFEPQIGSITDAQQDQQCIENPADRADAGCRDNSG